jgi:hypothetical protein
VGPESQKERGGGTAWAGRWKQGGWLMWMAHGVLGRGGRRERRAARREKRGGMGFWLLFPNHLLFSFFKLTQFYLNSNEI